MPLFLLLRRLNHDQMMQLSHVPSMPQAQSFDQPFPAFLASVVNVVKQALAAEQASNLPLRPQLLHPRMLQLLWSASRWSFTWRACPELHPNSKLTSPGAKRLKYYALIIVIRPSLAVLTLLLGWRTSSGIFRCR